jgi:hypothetical protein
MANILHLPKKKEALLKKLKGLIREKVSDTVLIITGRCTEGHTINTELTREVNEILAGEFLTSPKDANKILLCVGKGEICSSRETGTEVLWFLEIEDGGIHCLGSNNLKKLRETYNHMEIKIV